VSPPRDLAPAPKGPEPVSAILPFAMKEFFIAECAQQENKVIHLLLRGRVQAGEAQEDRRALSALTLVIVPASLRQRCGDNVDDVLDAFEQGRFPEGQGSGQQVQEPVPAHDSQSFGASGTRKSTSPTIFPKTTKDIDELWRTLADCVGPCRTRTSGP